MINKGRGGDAPMGPYQNFPHILLLSRQIVTGVFCNCHPHGYASFDREKSNQIGPIVFSLTLT